MRSVVDRHTVDWAPGKLARAIPDFGHRLGKSDRVLSLEIRRFDIVRVDLDDSFSAADTNLGSGWC